MDLLTERVWKTSVDGNNTEFLDLRDDMTYQLTYHTDGEGLSFDEVVIAGSWSYSNDVINFHSIDYNLTSYYSGFEFTSGYQQGQFFVSKYSLFSQFYFLLIASDTTPESESITSLGSWNIDEISEQSFIINQGEDKVIEYKFE